MGQFYSTTKYLLTPIRLLWVIYVFEFREWCTFLMNVSLFEPTVLRAMNAPSPSL